MATIKQELAVKEIVVNSGNVTQAMLKAGYSPNTANTPQRLTDSKGYKELLIEYGLTDKLVVEALVDDIKSKPGERVKELGLGADILGLTKRAENVSQTINYNFINAPETQEKIKAFEDDLKQQLISKPI